MGEFKQNNFTTGIQFFGSDMDIPMTGYQWAVNGRVRENGVKPIPKNITITNHPKGTLHGVASLGNILIIFLDNKAYYQLHTDPRWLIIAGYNMSVPEGRVWTQVVPDSTFNFKRTLATNGNMYEPVQAFPSNRVSGTPSGLVVQDGFTQPYLIFINDSNYVEARQLGNYAGWKNTSATPNDREYVPIGREMMFLNNKLFIVSRDKASVFHSVSGRPLDFMINVDSSGNKQATEQQGGADSVSFTFDYADITAILPSNVQNAFIYATATVCRLVEIDYSFTIFGEPRYKEAVPRITVGAINDKCIAEYLGDYVVLDREAITSFNAVSQLKWEGRNAIFSKPVSDIYAGIVQTNKVAVMNYSNYILFSSTSKFGPILAVFDTLSGVWVSFDITAAVRIKDFTVLTVDDSSQLYVVTYENKLIHMFGSETETERCMLRTRGFAATEYNEHKTKSLKLTFLGAAEGDTCRVIEYVDEVYGQEKTLEIKLQDGGINYEVKPPVIMANDRLVNYLTYEFSRGKAGKKVHFIVSWKGKAILKEIELFTEEINRAASRRQTAEQVNR